MLTNSFVQNQFDVNSLTFLQKLGENNFILYLKADFYGLKGYLHLDYGLVVVCSRYFVEFIDVKYGGKINLTLTE